MFPYAQQQQQQRVGTPQQQQSGSGGGISIAMEQQLQQQQQRHFMPPQLLPPPQQQQQPSTALALPQAAANGQQILKSLLPAVPAHCGPPTVSLALLLDFAIHQTLHELQVLSELNLKKKPEDRKISVVQFAHSTRLVFVRLLAIVRWLKSYKKFEPLTSIRFLLDEQAARYVESADRLVDIARNELPNARLPVFQVAQAVDVLTLGSYPRLPQNIKDRFISTPPLAGRQQRLTLRQLNRVLEFQLAQCARQLSPRIEQIAVRNGMATLLVPHEFEVSLTRLGDDPHTRWTLLNIRILVENAEVGQGQRLVHPLQLNFLHRMIQERLDNSEKPLLEAYSILHSFCRSLQLDVLYCQALKIAKMSANYIRVEEYNVKEGGRLVISYWLQRDGRNKLTSKHRFMIYGDKSNVHSQLKTKHWPASPDMPKMDQKLFPDEQCSQTTFYSLSLQRLLNETSILRCRERLLQARRLLEQSQAKMSTPPAFEQSGNCMLALTLPLVLVGDCHRDECLRVVVNTFFGTVHCSVQMLGSRDEIRELEQKMNSLNPIPSTIAQLLERLRILILMERLQRALVGLQVRPLSDIQALPLMSKLSSLPSDRRIFQFIREDHFYLVITFVPDLQQGVNIQFHLFTANEGRLTLLDLDADQIIKTAPLPRFHASEVDKVMQRHFSEFCNRKKESSSTNCQKDNPSSSSK